MIEFSIFERILLAFLLVLVILSAFRSYRILKNSINRGKNHLQKITVKQIFNTLISKVFLLLPTWKTRFWTNVFHSAIVWGFLFFLLVNVYDIFIKFFPEFVFPTGFAKIFFPLTDILSGLILFGVIYFGIRRIFFRKDLEIRHGIKMIASVRQSINRDSTIVLALIFIHVLSKIIAESLITVYLPNTWWMPITNTLSRLWIPTPFIIFFWKVFSWSSILSLFVFIPYFPLTKHFHLIMAPINFIFKNKSENLSPVQWIDFEDENVETFGANQLEEMSCASILDAYACIMCCRCQNVCPPYNSGSELSPAAYEINKRYYLNQNFGKFSQADFISAPLTDFAISEQAIWDCTACGACVEICPVGIDPLRDILQIRRHLVLMEDSYPKPFQLLFKNLDRYANPWGIDKTHRLDWVGEQTIPTIETNPNPELLWWVGCAGAYDTLLQNSSLAMLRILKLAKVNFAVLGQLENCTGDAARRAGKEDIFYQLANTNVGLLNEIQPKRILTGCSHCFHALKNEYPAFGGNYDVVHSSRFLLELLNSNLIKINSDAESDTISFHDPCYLSRFNQTANDPQKIFGQTKAKVISTQFQGSSTWCCGAGGAQVWKETEHVGKPVNQIRFEQLTAASPDKLITACPFCKTMMVEANQKASLKVKIEDISEHVLSTINLEGE